MVLPRRWGRNRKPMLSYELSRWWAYRHIRHPKMHIYVWVMPTIIACGVTAIFFALPLRPSITGKEGLFAGIIQILVLLPGFFIAALAAVATFARPEMDETMPSPAPTIILNIGGELEVELTRRMFLSYLFSYLSIASLLLVALCIAAQLVAPSANAIIVHKYFGEYHQLIKLYAQIVTVFLTFYLCGSIFITTLHGIFFMTERMHQPN
jgi:hypothetical protein